MKNIKLQNIVFFAGLMLLSGSCEKQLEQTNPNAQTSATFWQSQDDALKGVNAAYLTLAIDGGYMRSTNLLLDNRGDDLKSNSPWDQMYNSGKFALNAGNDAIYGWAYGAYYEGVSKANLVLDNVPKIAMDAELKKRVIGQAYFLRGLYFFHLVNMYGNVSLPLHSVQSKADFTVPQSTPEQGWNQVIDDLKKASEMLPTSYDGVTGSDKAQTGRATKGAAMGYLGKALLFNKRYQEAATQFKAIIDLGTYKLVSNYRDNFTEAKENNSESIFEVQFSRDAGGKDLNWGGEPAPGWGRVTGRAITYGARGLGWTDVQPTRWIFNEYQKEKTVDGKIDARVTATMFYNAPGIMVYGVEFSKRYGGNAQDLNDLFCRKYANDDTKADEFDWRSGINERLMRYADVLMMYAECLNELGRTSEAIPFVQQVRSRANLADLNTVMPNMNQVAFREQLAHERALEFCAEGHRFDDINRWGWLKDANKVAELKTHDPEFNTYKAGREYYPIPQREIENNDGVKQNPSY